MTLPELEREMKNELDKIESKLEELEETVKRLQLAISDGLEQIKNLKAES
jgi:hypothetical protein